MTTSSHQFDFSIKPSNMPEWIENRVIRPKRPKKPRHRPHVADSSSQSATTSVTDMSEVGPPCGPINLAFAEPAQCHQQPYREWFLERMKSSRCMTYFVTFWIHWMAILCMAALFFAGPEEFPPFLLDAVFSEAEPESDVLMEYAEVSIETPSTETPSTPEEVLTADVLAMTAQSPTLDGMPLDEMPDALRALAMDSQASGEASGQTETVKHDANPGPMNVPRHAVAAGSFAVWTEPENPDPGEPYRIVIQVRLPKGTERYSVADLEGVVVGSDGYQKLIPGPLRGFLPVQDGIAKLEVHIVSADKNVQDTVFIRSKMLREAQRLRLQF